MDRPRHIDQLAVNKIGKKIKKTPSHLPNLANGNVNKNDFISIVPQLTKPQNSALRKIRQVALIAQVNRPCVPPPPADQFWSDIAAESPVSVCMSSLQSSSGDSRPHGNQLQPSHQYQPQSTGVYGSSPDKPILPSPRLNDSLQGMYNSVSLPSARFSGGGILPTPVSVCIRSPQGSFGDSEPNRHQMQPSHHNQQPQPRNHHSPRFIDSASSVPILPSPRFSGRGILPTPPGVQCPPPRTPRSFTSSTTAQGGILGPGKFPQPPHASPALVFPPSPFGENTN
ncbi:unnamed protein product [Eruca vesicaria subsp. sativa]|uniref:Uncharacterized protein n=1 Tax=Eruca vesicaria subsp. sativa TaxID=29727 RepID=A0ABC8K3G7_ERUVS|nr:unnamed protein product [Eruca vesicaria subsp. sativa]